MEAARDAKKTSLYQLLVGYWQLAEKLNDRLLETYTNAVEDIPLEAVEAACRRIASGQAGLNTSFPPTPADIADRARMLESKPQPELHNGLISMNWGHGDVDLRGLTNDEQDSIMRGQGKIDGKNAALLDLDGKRAALTAVADARRLAAAKPVKTDA